MRIEELFDSLATELRQRKAEGVKFNNPNAMAEGYQKARFIIEDMQRGLDHTLAEEKLGHTNLNPLEGMRFYGEKR